MKDGYDVEAVPPGQQYSNNGIALAEQQLFLEHTFKIYYSVKVLSAYFRAEIQTVAWSRIRCVRFLSSLMCRMMITDYIKKLRRSFTKLTFTTAHISHDENSSLTFLVSPH